jgi:hypothetical protein
VNLSPVTGWVVTDHTLVGGRQKGVFNQVTLPVSYEVWKVTSWIKRMRTLRVEYTQKMDLTLLTFHPCNVVSCWGHGCHSCHRDNEQATLRAYSQLARKINRALGHPRIVYEQLIQTTHGGRT